LKTYYELLEIATGASAEEIKVAFRREIARYHPDKVQHLGTEFQEMAAVRAADLTEAYRILLDQEARRKYDASLTAGGAGHPSRSSPPPAAPVAAPEAERRGAANQQPPSSRTDRRFDQDRATSEGFLRKAAVTRLREAVAAVSGGVAVSVPGCDAAFDLKGRGGLFKKAEAPLRLLAIFAPQVDAVAVADSWPVAARGAKGTDLVCLLLLGAAGLAPAKELSIAVAEQRRKWRTSGPVVIPVDVRDWDALYPPEAPASVRAIMQWLKGKR
jgi:hypothetical protein